MRTSLQILQEIKKLAKKLRGIKKFVKMREQISEKQTIHKIVVNFLPILLIKIAKTD